MFIGKWVEHQSPEIKSLGCYLSEIDIEYVWYFHMTLHKIEWKHNSLISFQQYYNKNRGLNSWLVLSRLNYLSVMAPTGLDSLLQLYWVIEQHSETAACYLLSDFFVKFGIQSLPWSPD